MSLDKSSPNLDALLLATVLELELSERDRRVANKRYHLIPEHLQRPSSPLRPFLDDAVVYAQGSRAIGATIVHGADEDRFDLDAVLEFPRPMGWSISRVLDELHAAFEGFPDVQKIERCTRCVQLQFAFMHLDVTPMDPASEPRIERVGTIYHSPDNGNDELFDVNPYGFATWFNGNVSQPSLAFQKQLKDMRERMAPKDRFVTTVIHADAEIEDLPVETHPLRDAPQVIALKLMKRFLNIRYAKREEKRPISIYLSKVAAEILADPNGLCSQLENFAANLGRKMTFALETRQWPEERNPAFPSENFNDRWPTESGQMSMFRDDLRHLVHELERARRSEFVEIRQIFEGLFGVAVTEKAVRSYLSGFSDPAGQNTYQRGKGFVAAPALVSPSSTGAPRVSRAVPHSFHAGKLQK
ncbi:nucleotidyltransferase [Roseibium sp. ROS1]